MNERAGGAPSQSVFRATMYTGRILFILGLASIRSVPPRCAACGSATPTRWHDDTADPSASSLPSRCSSR